MLNLYDIIMKFKQLESRNSCWSLLLDSEIYVLLLLLMLHIFWQSDSWASMFLIVYILLHTHNLNWEPTTVHHICVQLVNTRIPYRKIQINWKKFGDRPPRWLEAGPVMPSCQSSCHSAHLCNFMQQKNPSILEVALFSNNFGYSEHRKKYSYAFGPQGHHTEHRRHSKTCDISYRSAWASLDRLSSEQCRWTPHFAF